MIAELSYINSKSLLHLAGSGQCVHQAFAVVGAIAFSLVTIIVMQQPNLKWQKVVFPVFDAALVFLGFNLDYHPDMRIYLTVFMALFAGCIMYSLGKIEYHQGESNESKQLEEKQKTLNETRLELESVKSELKVTETQLYNTESNLQKVSADFDNLKTEFQKAKSNIEVMESDYIKYNVGRINRKKEQNLTPEDLEFLKQHKNLVA
jgi:hypothetical protein